MRRDHTDVLIIGGGPAGGAAAITCAKEGLRVILVEREVFGRERPGETLHPGTEPLLQRLGLADALTAAASIRHTGIWLEWNAQRRFEAFGGSNDNPWHGFQVWRSLFDSLVLTQAQRLGVDIRQPCMALSPLVANGVVMGAQTDTGHISAPIVIDASGHRRLFARKFALPISRHSPPLVARYGYIEGSYPAGDDAPRFTANRLGWTWRAKVRPDIYQWTHLPFVKEKMGVRWRPEEFRGLALSAKTRGADVTWRLLDQAAGPAWFVVGDAAATLDPASSHGVLRAIMSGMLAARLAFGILRRHMPHHAAATAYQTWLQDGFYNDLNRLRQFYRDLGAENFT